MFLFYIGFSLLQLRIRKQDTLTRGDSGTFVMEYHAAGCENVTLGTQLAHLADETSPARGIFLAGAKSSAPGTKLSEKSSVAAADALRDSMVHSMY